MKRYFPAVLLVLFFMLNIIMVLQLLGDLDINYRNFFYNSDALYLPSIFRDLFEDRTGLSGWNLNNAPNFIPEWPLYFAVRALSGDFRTAGIVYAVLQFALFLLLTSWIYRVVFGRSSPCDLVWVNLSPVVLLMLFFSRGDFYSIACLFLGGYHNGAFLMALASIGLSFSWMKTKQWWLLVLLFLCVFTATLSDRLYLIIFTLPLMALFLLVRSMKNRKAFLWMSGIVAVATLGGLMTYRLINFSPHLVFWGLHGKIMNWDNILPSLAMHAEYLLKQLTGGGFFALTVLVTLLMMAAGLYALAWMSARSLFFRRRTDVLGASGLKQEFVFFSFALIILVMINPVLNGVESIIIRYFIYAFYFALFLLPVLVLQALRHHRYRDRIITAVAIAATALLAFQVSRQELNNNTAKGLKELQTFYPEWVQLIDRVASAHDLQYGVSEYWTAKKVTMFSKHDLRVYCVFSNLHPWYHVTNSNWFHDTGRGRHGHPEFRFIIDNNLGVGEHLTRYFGDDIDTLRNGELVMYRVPAFVFDRDNGGFPVLIDDREKQLKGE